jgi:hypothetical protein
VPQPLIGERARITAPRMRKARIATTDNPEPTERIDPKEPTEPTDRQEPTEAIEKAESRDAIDSTEFSDQGDHLDLRTDQG